MRKTKFGLPNLFLERKYWLSKYMNERSLIFFYSNCDEIMKIHGGWKLA